MNLIEKFNRTDEKLVLVHVIIVHFIKMEFFFFTNVATVPYIEGIDAATAEMYLKYLEYLYIDRYFVFRNDNFSSPAVWKKYVVERSS